MEVYRKESEPSLRKQKGFPLFFDILWVVIAEDDIASHKAATDSGSDSLIIIIVHNFFPKFFNFLIIF